MHLAAIPTMTFSCNESSSSLLSKRHPDRASNCLQICSPIWWGEGGDVMSDILGLVFISLVAVLLVWELGAHARRLYRKAGNERLKYGDPHEPGDG